MCGSVSMDVTIDEVVNGLRGAGRKGDRQHKRTLGKAQREHNGWYQTTKRRKTWMHTHTECTRSKPGCQEVAIFMAGDDQWIGRPDMSSGHFHIANLHRSHALVYRRRDINIRNPSHLLYHPLNILGSREQELQSIYRSKVSDCQYEIDTAIRIVHIH